MGPRSASPFFALVALALLVVSEAPDAARAGDSPATDNLLFAGPIFTDGDHLLVRIEVNGKPATFLVDTGANRTVLDERFRKELGQKKRDAPVETASGSRINREIFFAPVIRAGSLEWGHDEEVVCMDLSVFRDETGFPVVGVLGTDFLYDMVVRLDFQRGQIEFLKRAPADSGEEVLMGQSEDGCPVAFLVFPEGFTRVFVIDTGSNSCLSFEPSLVRRLNRSGDLGPFGKRWSIDMAGIEKECRKGVCREVRIGETIVGKAEFTEAGQNGIGLDFLRRFVVTLDFPKRSMHLLRREKLVVSPKLVTSGLVLRKDSGGILVRSVRARSAAETAGLRSGDRLIRIADRDPSTLRLFEVHTLLSATAQVVPVRVDRDGKTQELSLTLPDVTDSLE